MSAEARHGRLDLDDHQEITDLIHRYCRAVDDYDINELVGLFTPDGTMCFTSDERGTVVGHEALRRRVGRVLSGLEATSHHATNVLLSPAATLADGTPTATGVTYLYAWHRFIDDRPDGHLWGRYHDRFVKTDLGWRIAERTLQIAGELAFPMPWNPIDPPRRTPL